MKHHFAQDVELMKQIQKLIMGFHNIIRRAMPPPLAERSEGKGIAAT